MLESGFVCVSDGDPVVQLERITKRFHTGAWHSSRGRSVTAVEDVSFRLDEGTSIGLVGESGCGKTTLARILLLLEPPTSGAIRLRGRDVTRARGSLLRDFRASVQAVFQDPWSSLDPRHTVRDAVLEPLIVQQRIDRRSARQRARELLALVGLPATYADRYPHELSGGQRQRVAIARAISVEPALVVLDEPVSSLDVSVRAQILNLLAEIQRRTATTYLIIGHHLSSVAYVSRQIDVMYLGRIVEVLSAADLLRARHPYTQALVAAALPTHPRERGRPLPILGDIASPYALPSGCRYRTRCPYAMPVCAETEPPLRGSHGSAVACHLYAEDEQPDPLGRTRTAPAGT